MKILFVTHTDFPVPKYLQTWASARHFELKFSIPFRGEKLPQTSEFDWLVLMGGTQCLQEKNRYPFIKNEINLVEKAIGQNKTIQVFCLGVQIIGEAYDMGTEPSPER